MTLVTGQFLMFAACFKTGLFMIKIFCIKVDDVKVIDDIKDASKYQGYCRRNKTICVSRSPKLMEYASIGIVVSTDNKPKILLNISEIQECELNWRPAILKVGLKVK